VLDDIDDNYGIAPVNDVTLHRMTKKYSAGTQQYSMMIERGYPRSRHPQTQFKIDLKKLVEGFFNQQHDILLMGDFNEDLETNIDGLRSATMGFIDLMQVKIGHKIFLTHIDGQTRIDFAFATPRVVEACTHAGYEPFRHRFETDHRGFFLDLDNAVLFGNQTAILQSPSQRGLTSKSFKHRKTYIASRWKYLNHHKWFERLRQALQQEEVPSTILEKLDRDWTAFALAAEKKCQSYPAGPYSQEIAKL
jgi:endonuclease/exonuclease/phosphatase (EEP) superfamily protein YafD